MKGRKPNPFALDEQVEMKPPKHFKGEAAKAWKRLVEILGPQRIVSHSDYYSLMILCESWAVYRRAEDAIAKDGDFLIGQKGELIKHPAHTLINQAWERIRPLLSEFGLTPTARSRFLLDVDNDKDDTDFF